MYGTVLLPSSHVPRTPTKRRKSSSSGAMEPQIKKQSRSVPSDNVLAGVPAEHPDVAAATQWRDADAGHHTRLSPADADAGVGTAAAQSKEGKEKEKNEKSERPSERELRVLVQSRVHPPPGKSHRKGQREKRASYSEATAILRVSGEQGKEKTAYTRVSSRRVSRPVLSLPRYRCTDGASWIQCRMAAERPINTGTKSPARAKLKCANPDIRIARAKASPTRRLPVVVVFGRTDGRHARKEFPKDASRMPSIRGEAEAGEPCRGETMARPIQSYLLASLARVGAIKYMYIDANSSKELVSSSSPVQESNQESNPKVVFSAAEASTHRPIPCRVAASVVEDERKNTALIPSIHATQLGLFQQTPQALCKRPANPSGIIPNNVFRDS
ncbi:hypothetical protein B0H14DRAFT_2558373 [Mycena olivaceomarginata]|nr:hypothetical protein B0H14DRAFT_2558373 [Mycena olivaceomarginata]